MICLQTVLHYKDQNQVIQKFMHGNSRKKIEFLSQSQWFLSLSIDFKIINSSQNSNEIKAIAHRIFHLKLV